MIPLHELLNRIQWDPEFGRGDFMLAYLDRLRHGLVYVQLSKVRRDPESHFCFEVIDGEGVVHSVPYHRVKEVWKDGEPIWRREH